MKKLKMPKINLFKAIPSWTVEDRHQLRVFLRKLRTHIRLLKKERKRLPVDKLKLSRLDKLSKEFLDSCGEVRDIDVLIETMKNSGLHSKALKKILQANRRKAINNLKQQWSVKKRRELMVHSKQFIDYLQQKKPLKKKLILKNGNKLMRDLIHEEPESKNDWHKFRRNLRRTNYLFDLVGKGNIYLDKFQKFLGIVHDLENLKKFSREHTTPINKSA